MNRPRTDDSVFVFGLLEIGDIVMERLFDSAGLRFDLFPFAACVMAGLRLSSAAFSAGIGRSGLNCRTTWP
ncbi:MAG: hypothetical protein ACI9VS_003218 [Candidatus Binatia bacterium]|jgi:hypothetical protein